MADQLKLFDNQVSGKTAKFTDIEGKQVYKELSKTQYSFYNFMNNLKVHESQYSFKKFIPKFKGKRYLQTLHVATTTQDSSKKSEWINHISDRRRANIDQSLQKQYIALENLGVGYKYPCVMDIKLGRKKVAKSSNKKFQNSTTNSHHFRINGMTNLFITQNQPHFISKYYFQKTSQQQIQTHLAFFFYNGQTIDKKLIQKCIEIIKDIVLSMLSFKAGNFDSASLLIMYDAYDHQKFAVKIIDFDKYYPSTKRNQDGDQNIIVGLKYIIWYLNNIDSQYQIHQDAIKNRKIKFFDHAEVVPEQKKKQFTPKTQKNLKQKQKTQTESPTKDSLSSIPPQIPQPQQTLTQTPKN